MWKDLFRRLFFKPLHIEIPPHEPVDVVSLDNSFNLLKSTTVEVSQAAVDAARSLENQLHLSFHRFYSMIDAIDDFVVIKDDQARWIALNKTGQHVFGWVHGEYYQKTSSELAELYPQFAPSLRFGSNTDIHAWETHQPQRNEETFAIACGQMQTFDVITTPVFNPDGTRKELIVVGRNVTDAREKQRRTRACFTALNSASDAIIIIDAEHTIFFCNDEFLRRFDLGDYHNVVGRNIVDVCKSFPDSAEIWEYVKQNQTWYQACPSTNQTLTIVPVMNGVDTPIYYICTIKT